MKTLLIILLSLSIYCPKDTFHKENKNTKINISITQNTSSKEQDLKNRIIEVIQHYNEKDERGLNKLIYPDMGMHLLYRRGTLDVWERIDSIYFNPKWADNIKIPYWIKEKIRNQKIQTDYKIKESNSKILIRCDSIKKEGLFIVKDTSTNNLLSNTIKKYADFLHIEKIMPDEIQKELSGKIIEVKKWEENSVRITVSKKEQNFYGNIFIFYMTYIDNLWWITILDYASMDCSV